jgi:hypothetical protein
LQFRQAETHEWTRMITPEENEPASRLLSQWRNLPREGKLTLVSLVLILLAIVATDFLLLGK